MNNETIRKGWHAAVMVIGTTKIFLFADFALLYEAIITPLFTGRKIPKPAPELIGIAGILAIASIYSPRPVDGLQTAFRIALLASILPTFTYGFHYKKMLGFVLLSLALLVAGQSAFIDRPAGIHMNALLLAESAFVFMPVFWYEIGLAGALILVMSLSRTPLVAFVIFAVLSRRTYFIGLAAITSAMFLVYVSVSAPDKLTIGGLVESVATRGETITGLDDERLATQYNDGRCGEVRAIEHTTYGYGFYGFCASTGQPRPHNIYALSFYELGVLFLPFWALIIYAARRLNYVQVLPLLALGMVSDNLFGRPEGVYLVAAWIISTGLMKSRTPESHRQKTGVNREVDKIE